MRANVKMRGRKRGQAMLEFALVVPLFVTLLLFSLFFTEEVRGLLKLQEAARYAAWEMTSYTLTDFGKGDNDHAFDIAQGEVTTETQDRFKDLDSVEDNQPFTMFADFDKPTVKIENETINFVDSPIGGGGALGGILGGVSNSINFVLNQWGFNSKGKVKVTVNSAIHNKIVGQHFFDTGTGAPKFSVDQWGGHSINNLPFTNSFSLVATGWDLPDGGNANATQGKAGRHGDKKGGGDDSGLWTEVNRMVFLGLKNKFEQVPGVQSLGNVLGFFLPAFVGTFVVDHSYVPSTDNGDCSRPTHPAIKGTNNLDDTHNGYPGLDFDKERCYDTAPFQDTAGLGSNSSSVGEYIQIFNARGDNFMGCKNSQADDPNFQQDPETSDQSNPKTNCE
jgi:hypothetical protein